MAYAGFIDHGYKYFDKGHYLLFSENDTHDLLFNYVAQDISGLTELFDLYISQRMDISTFKLYDYSWNNTAIDQMQKVLIAAHPYYKYEANEVLIRAIGDYFNSLLLYLRYYQRINIPDFSKAWYMERITNLLGPLLKQREPSRDETEGYPPENLYNEYQKQIGESIYTAGQSDIEMEIFVCDIPRKMPVGLSNEIRTQSEIYNMLYFLLDISAQELDELTTQQRVWLYSNITATSKARITVSKQLSLKNSIIYRDNYNERQIAEYSRTLDDKFRSLYDICGLNVGRDGIPASMSKDFHSAVEYTKTVTIPKPYEEYKIDCLYQLLYLEILSMIQDKVMIRKCRRCGKYFVVANRKIAYCNRIDESGVCCSTVGSRQSFQKKMEADEALQIYNRAYKTHHARVRKGKMSKSSFEIWCNEAKQKLSEARAGELDIVSFQKWLKE